MCLSVKFTGHREIITIVYNFTNRFHLFQRLLVSKYEHASVGDDDEDEVDHNSTQQSQESKGWFSAFESLVGNKQLAAADIEPVMNKMKETLTSKIFGILDAILSIIF